MDVLETLKEAGGRGGSTGADGGRATGPVGGSGRSGPEEGGAPLEGGRGGRLIRTVSRASAGFAGARGGSVIRTVSFLGSFGSLICAKCFSQSLEPRCLSLANRAPA